MKLYLDSNNSSNGQYDLDEPIGGRWRLLSFAFTNNIYNVNETNNKIYFNENGTNLIAELTIGYYDASDLKTNISEAMNNVSNGNITITYDDKPGKFTIKNTLGYYFTFGTNKVNSASKLIGFNDVDGVAYSQTQISDKSIDLNTYKEIFVNISKNNDRSIIGVDYFNTSLFIVGSGGVGELVRYNYQDFTEQYVDLKRTKKITIKIHDSNENEINLNSDYSMILEKY